MLYSEKSNVFVLALLEGIPVFGVTWVKKIHDISKPFGYDSYNINWEHTAAVKAAENIMRKTPVHYTRTPSDFNVQAPIQRPKPALFSPAMNWTNNNIEKLPHNLQQLARNAVYVTDETRLTKIIADLPGTQWPPMKANETANDTIELIKTIWGIQKSPELSKTTNEIFHASLESSLDSHTLHADVSDMTWFP